MYVYTDSWFSSDLCPTEGETYTAFIARVTPAIKALKPEMSDEEISQVVEGAWAKHILDSASQAVVTLKREFIMNPIYQEGWWTSWEIAEVHSAVMASMTFTAVTKSKDDKFFHIAKTAEDKQLIFGWANVAKEADGSFPLDWDTDVTDPSELEAAAYQFVLKYRETGEQHAGEAVGTLVESMMFTKEKQQALGIPEGILPEGWWVGFHIPDKEVFAKCKDGEYEMLSVQGKARRVPTGQ